MATITRTFRRLGLAAGVAALSLAAAPAAHAGLLVESATDCTPQPTKQVFRPWLDPLNYVPVTAGDFESGTAGWKLSGARTVAGNEPWRVGASSDSRSLSIPSGASATSPAMCAGLDHLVMRYFARGSNAGLLGTLTSHLRVEVLTELAGGQVVALPLGIQPYSISTSWTPSLPVPVVANLLPLLPGEHTPVAFRFTAVGPADWKIDDVHLDPRYRG